jgi:hypothetical protein
VVQRGQIPPHIGRRLSFGLCQHSSRNRGALPVSTNDAFAFEVSPGGQLDLEGDQRATIARLIFPRQGLSTHGTRPFGFTCPCVVSSLLLAEAEGIDYAFVTEEVTFAERPLAPSTTL